MSEAIPLQNIPALIRGRKSVRSFSSRPLSREDRERLETYLGEVTNPFGIPVAFRLLDAEQHGLSSPVVVGAGSYLAAKTVQREHFEIAYGYSFEKVCLYAASLGLGTVMLAATLSRSAFEKAMDLKGGEVMPVASPVGYPAEKRSMRESLMRKGMKSDERLPFEQLFFEGGFETPLARERSGRFAEALELSRWAPSATNQQPWRAVVAEGIVHFYEKQTIKESKLGDIQKVDVGNALAHFDLAMEAKGNKGSWLFQEPELARPERMFYVASYTLDADA